MDHATQQRQTKQDLVGLHLTLGPPPVNRASTYDEHHSHNKVEKCCLGKVAEGKDYPGDNGMSAPNSSSNPDNMGIENLIKMKIDMPAVTETIAG